MDYKLQKVGGKSENKNVGADSGHLQSQSDWFKVCTELYLYCCYCLRCFSTTQNHTFRISNASIKVNGAQNCQQYWYYDIDISEKITLKRAFNWVKLFGWSSNETTSIQLARVISAVSSVYITPIPDSRIILIFSICDNLIFLFHLKMFFYFTCKLTQLLSLVCMKANFKKLLQTCSDKLKLTVDESVK